MNAHVFVWLLSMMLVASCQRTPVADPQPANPVTAFLRNNPARSSMRLFRNDTLLVDLRPDQKMPLASTSKIIVAIEFARQVAAGRLNPQELVRISDLDLYYLPNTDGGAHPDWMQAMSTQQLLVNGQVPLLEVARGMIRYSSNANTDYLLERLGRDAVNANLSQLNLPQHDPLLPLAASLLLYSTSNKAATLQQLRGLSAPDYQRAVLQQQERLKTDSDGSLKRAFIFPDLDLQKLWSDRLPASTTAEYVSVLRKINSRTYFAPAVQRVLEQQLEWLLTANPASATSYQHLGFKGGSTAFVLTMAAYAVTREGDRTELAFFFNDLSPDEFKTLADNANTFLTNCVQKNTYRQIVNDLRP